MNQHSPNPLRLGLTASSASVSALLAIAGTLIFVGVGATGLLLYAVLLLCVLCGQLLALLRRSGQTDQLPPAVGQLLRLARDARLAEVQQQLAAALERIADQTDPIFRKLAAQRLDRLVQQAQLLADKAIEYTSTESWRVAYEELLRSPGLHLYRSVARIESTHYWQDGPGQQSMRLNLELQDSRTVSIERLAIIADHLWPAEARFPDETIHDWLDEQHRHGIWVLLVRESQVAAEPDLLSDLGIYGNRAVGLQRADPAGRTMRFVLSFDFDKVRAAEGVWNRLLVYAVSYREILDQPV